MNQGFNIRAKLLNIQLYFQLKKMSKNISTNLTSNHNIKPLPEGWTSDPNSFDEWQTQDEYFY